MSPSPKDSVSTFDNYTALIRSGDFDVEAEGPRETRLTVRTTSRPTKVYSRTFEVSRDQFLAEHPSLVKGAYFHAEIWRGKLAKIHTYEDDDADLRNLPVPVEPEPAAPTSKAPASEVCAFDFFDFSSDPDAVIYEAEGEYARCVEQKRVGLSGVVTDTKAKRAGR